MSHRPAARQTVAQRATPSKWPTRWEIWTVPRRRWLAYALSCEALAVVVATVDLWRAPLASVDLVWFSALLLLGVGQAEASRHIERSRRWMGGGKTHINVTSVWLVAGAILLSPGCVSLLAAALYLHLWLRVWRQVRSRPTHRVVSSTALVMLSSWCAAFTLHISGLDTLAETTPGVAAGAATVVLAASAFELVNLVLASTSIFLNSPSRTLSDMLGNWDDNALELVTLCLGGLTAIALVYQPVMVALILPPLVLLHRNVLIKQLEHDVATDDKTGLYNATGWHRLARGELARAKRGHTSLAVFMIDIDHFKRINDTHGHLAGDLVIQAIADSIANTVRSYDSVGRFGGEEFTVLLPDITEPDAHDVAERIRHAVTQLRVQSEDGTAITRLSVSIGTALYPTAGATTDGLIHAADQALLQAKRSGRNRVVANSAAVA